VPLQPRADRTPASAQPLVGRTAELAALADAVAARRTMLVLGEPGIGKTRLLDELAAVARSRGVAVLRGRGIEAELARPYGAWLDAFTGAAELLPRTEGETDRARLFDAVVAALRARGTVLVILDDVQWLDDASAALAHYVARSAPEVTIACGARPGELADNPAALRLVRVLGRDRSICQIELAPLGAAETAALVAAYAPGVDGARVFTESGGHPLFAVELARAFTRGDAHSSSLDALLAERLELVDGVAAEVLPWAAALGGAFTADLITAVAAVSLADLARAMTELEERSLLRATATGWDFAHDLIRAAAYRRISEPRRRLLHLQIARTLAALPDPEGERSVELAHHAQLGGDARLCARACLAAARHCMRVFAVEQAAMLADRGLEHAARLTGEERAQLRIELWVAAYDADVHHTRRAAIAAELERAIVDARAVGCHAAAARGLSELSRKDYDAGDFTRAHQRSLHAIQRVRAANDPEQEGRTLAFSAQCIALLGRDLDHAEAIASEAAALLDGVDDCAELPFALSVIRYHQGEDDASVTLALRGVTLAVAAGRYWLAAQAWTRCALIEVTRGRPHAALEHCEALRENAAKVGDGGDVPFGEVLAACARWQLGERDDARLGAALAALRRADAPALIAAALCCIAELELAAGELAAARAHAEDAVRAADRAERSTDAAIARSLLVRIMRAAGEPTDTSDLAAIDPSRVAARARAAIAAVI